MGHITKIWQSSELTLHPHNYLYTVSQVLQFMSLLCAFSFDAAVSGVWWGWNLFVALACTSSGMAYLTCALIRIHWEEDHVLCRLHNGGSTSKWDILLLGVVGKSLRQFFTVSSKGDTEVNPFFVTTCTQFLPKLMSSPHTCSWVEKAYSNFIKLPLPQRKTLP